MTDRSHLRSFVCALGHELRVTKRCLTDDVADSCDASFDELVGRHGIIRAFLRERRGATSGMDTLGPGGGDRPLTVLRHTNDWRGVTWYDEETAVVWLCACARHRSGQPDDAFPRFEALRQTGHIWPIADDYESLAADRGEQFISFVLSDAPRLLAKAQAEPDIEHTMVIGLEPVSIVVEVVETLEETFVAVSAVRLLPSQFQVLLAALYPDRSFMDWRSADRLPTRPLDHTRAEFCMSIVH